MSDQDLEALRRSAKEGDALSRAKLQRGLERVGRDGIDVDTLMRLVDATRLARIWIRILPCEKPCYVGRGSTLEGLIIPEAWVPVAMRAAFRGLA